MEFEQDAYTVTENKLQIKQWNVSSESFLFLLNKISTVLYRVWLKNKTKFQPERNRLSEDFHVKYFM